MGAAIRSNSSRGVRAQHWFLSGLLTFCIASPCSSHQKWLWPNRFVAEKAPVWLSFDVTWSDEPFNAEKGVGDQPLSIVDPAGGRESPSRIFIGKTKSTAEAELVREGTYRVEAVDPLAYWTRVEKDGHEQWIKKPKNVVTGAKITRADLYWAKAVAYITVGKQTEMRTSDKADPLDLVPLTHPNEIPAGRPLELRVLSYGAPLPSAEIRVFGPNNTGHEPIQSTKCDDQGLGKIQIDKAGRYLFTCEIERKVADDPKADVHSFHLYLTLLIH